MNPRNDKRKVFLCILISLTLIIGSVSFVSAGTSGKIHYPDTSSVAEVNAGLSEKDIIEDLTSKPLKSAEYDGYIVKLNDGALGKIDASAMKRTAEKVIGDDIAVVNRLEDALKFADARDIEIIEPNYKLSALAFPQTDPADPYYAANYQWGIKYVNAKAAWQANYRGAGVHLAIIDTGIVSGHEDLGSDKIFSELDWVNGDYDASDDNMHGSVVGGIIAADTNNYALGSNDGVGMAGITDKVDLMIHKVLDYNGRGETSAVLSALYEILQDDNRVDVINLSLGSEGYSTTENDLIQQIIAKGTIVVAATGNNGLDTDGTANMMNYPAGLANVIGVGSIGQSGIVSGFSTKNSSVDVVAPGELMVGLRYETTDGYLVHYADDDEEYPLNGTSFAAPVVAAAAVIAKQRDKNIDAGAFLTALKRTSRAAGPPGYDTSYGNGILDIEKLINYLKTGALTATFDANGGSVGAKSKTVWAGGKYGTLPTPKRSKYGFEGWYTKKTGGVKITPLSVVGNSSVRLYAHWQGGTTLSDLKANAGKLSPAFSYKKRSYKLALTSKQSSVKITPVKAYKSAKMQIKTGSAKYKTKSSVTVKLKKGKQATVYVRLTGKGIKTTTYKITVKRKK
jgi:uncharacterized repeat protein (TIGR02543 family)